MWTDFSLLQQVLLFALAAVAFFYVFHFRIWLAAAFGADLLFLIAFTLATTSIAFPQIYERAAREVVDQSPLPAALDSADARLAALYALPGEIVDAALARVGLGPDEDEEVGEDDLTSPGDSERMEQNGPFVSTVRPSVEALITRILRGAGLVSGWLLMLTALAIRSTTTTARRVHELTQRVSLLEAGHLEAAETAAPSESSPP